MEEYIKAMGMVMKRDMVDRMEKFLTLKQEKLDILKQQEERDRLWFKVGLLCFGPVLFILFLAVIGAIFHVRGEGFWITEFDGSWLIDYKGWWIWMTTTNFYFLSLLW